MSEIENLIIVLQQFLNTKKTDSNIDYVIARYLLQNLYRKNLSINTISEECHISKASVTRFAQTLGYQGFSQLKQDFDSLEIVRDEMRIDFLALSKSDKAPLEAKTKRLQEEFSAVSNDFQKYNLEIDLDQIEQLCEAIYDADEVHLFSTHIPGNIATALQNILLTAGKLVIAYPDSYHQFEGSKNLTKNNLALFISLEGSYVMNRSLTLSITSSEATSVLVTQNPTMKLGSLFDYIVPLGDHNLERSGKYKLLLFVEYLAHIYFNKYVSD